MTFILIRIQFSISANTVGDEELENMLRGEAMERKKSVMGGKGGNKGPPPGRGPPPGMGGPGGPGGQGQNRPPPPGN